MGGDVEFIAHGGDVDLLRQKRGAVKRVSIDAAKLLIGRARRCEERRCEPLRGG